MWAVVFEIVKGSQDVDLFEKSYQGSDDEDSKEWFWRRFVCGFGGRGDGEEGGREGWEGGGEEWWEPSSVATRHLLPSEWEKEEELQPAMRRVRIGRGVCIIW